MQQETLLYRRCAEAASYATSTKRLSLVPTMTAWCSSSGSGAKYLANVDRKVVLGSGERRTEEFWGEASQNTRAATRLLLSQYKCLNLPTPTLDTLLL